MEEPVARGAVAGQIAESMPPHQLILLGTGSGKATSERASSSYLLDLGDHGVLLDIGDGATRNFLAAGYSPEWVSDIVLTHPHADHICGFGYFIQQRHLSRTDQPLMIHAVPQLHVMLEEIIEFGMLYPDRMTFAYTFRALAPGRTTDLGGATIQPFPTTHQKEMRAHALATGRRDPGDTMALLVKTGDVSLLYSADLGALNDLDSSPGRFDWLLIETTHVSLNQLWTWAEAKGVRRIILTHIGADFDPAAVHEAPKYTSADVIVARDGLGLELTLA